MKSLPLVLLTGLAAAGCAAPGPPVAVPAVPDPVTRSLRIRPDPIAFADTFVGCTGSASVKLENSDPERPLIVTNVSSSSPAFRLPDAAGLTLEPGQKHTLEARFTPVESGRGEGTFDFTTNEDAGPRYRVVHAAMGIEPPSRPLDLVFVLDVSTSMDEIAMLRRAIATLFDSIEAESAQVRVGLTTFENDVVVHQRGAFLDRAAFFRELDTQLVSDTWIPDSSLPRQLLNFELEENLLDALHDSATRFDFRPEARRFLVAVTDDTFLEPPAVFGDGNPVRHSYAEVAAALAAHDITLFSVHVDEKGEGLSSAHGDQVSLVAQTGGDWLELRDARTTSLEQMLIELITRPDCR
jgi:hypothetical protein